LLASIIFYDGNQSETHKLGPICCEPDFVHLEFRPLGSVDDMRTPTACKNPAFLFFPYFRLFPREISHVFLGIDCAFVDFCAFSSKIKWKNDGNKT
jgi:hypothetical protein